MAAALFVRPSIIITIVVVVVSLLLLASILSILTLPAAKEWRYYLFATGVRRELNTTPLPRA